MNSFLTKTLACFGFLTFGFAAAAQYGPGYQQYPNPNYGREERPYNRGYNGQVFDRVQADLDRIGSFGFVSRGDRNRVNHAKKEVWDFQSRFVNGNFSRRELDEAIGSVQHVIDSNRMDPGMRDELFRDVQVMRGFRARNEGGYGYPRY